jgi:uncharacterized protein (TIGR02996 family)
MTDDFPFLRTIAAHPDDDAPRLVFADWLEERGETYAEFIRLQCGLPTPTAHARAAALLAASWRNWLAPVCAALDDYSPLDTEAVAEWLLKALSAGVRRPTGTYRWGYLLDRPFGVVHHVKVWDGEQVRLQRADFSRGFAERLALAAWGPLAADHFRRLADCSPLRGLQLDVRNTSEWPRLDGPHFTPLSELTLRRDGPLVGVASSAELIRAVGHSPHLVGLRRLGLDFNDAGPAVRALAASPLAGRLEQLHARMDDDVLTAVLETTAFTALRRLSLAGEARSAADLVSAADAGRPPTLEDLTLRFTFRVPPDLARLFASPGVRRLRRLALHGNLPAGLLRIVAEAAPLAALRELVIDGVSLSGPDWQANARAPAALFDSTRLAALQILRLQCRDGIEHFEQGLASATGLPAMTTLDLSGMPLHASGVATLAGCPLAARLRHVVLDRCFLDGREVGALTAGAWDQLETLSVAGNRLSESGRRELSSRFGDRVRF